jgi:pimeloyl-ACP methyl ester carboxylesterase
VKTWESQRYSFLIQRFSNEAFLTSVYLHSLRLAVWQYRMPSPTALFSILLCLGTVAAFQALVGHHQSHQSKSKYFALNNENHGNPKHDLHNVQFLSPLFNFGYRPAVVDYESGNNLDKPLLLYLPGMDGTYLSPFIQFPELHTIFDIQVMNVPMNDRSTFPDLVEQVMNHLDELSEHYKKRRSKPENRVKANTTKIAATKNNSNWLPSALSGRTGSIERGNKELATETKTTIISDGNAMQQTKKNARPIYLMGESFGGILALEVAHQILRSDSNNNDNSLHGLVLINPATCYDRSQLAAIGPRVADLPFWQYPAGLLFQLVLPLFTDKYSFQQLTLILQGQALPSVIDSAEREAYLGRVALSLPKIAPFMTQSALQWRLREWLHVGCNAFARRSSGEELHSTESYTYTNLRILIVAAEKDGALPSLAEAERLAGYFPDTQVHVVKGAGHASTCGSRVDLAALCRKRFFELRGRSEGDFGSRSEGCSGRTAMKESAAAGEKEFFGMEARYDNQTVGLNPLTYWSSQYYQKYIPRRYDEDEADL